MDLELRQNNPAVKARKVMATTRVTHYHRISCVEPAGSLERWREIVQACSVRVVAMAVREADPELE
jgi:hypothetical protein